MFWSMNQHTVWKAGDTCRGLWRKRTRSWKVLIAVLRRWSFILHVSGPADGF